MTINYLKQCYKSAQTGNFEEFKEAIQSGIDIKNIIDVILIEAVNSRNIEMVDYLLNSTKLKKHANIHYEEERALYWAASNTDYKMFSFLIKNGANIKTNNYEAYRKLIENSAENDLEINQEEIENWSQLLKNDMKTNKKLEDFIHFYTSENNVEYFINLVMKTYHKKFEEIEKKYVMKLISNAIKFDKVEFLDMILNENKKYEINIKELVIESCMLNKLEVFKYLTQKENVLEIPELFQIAIKNSLPIALHLIEKKLNNVNNTVIKQYQVKDKFYQQNPNQGLIHEGLDISYADSKEELIQLLDAVMIKKWNNDKVEESFNIFKYVMQNTEKFQITQELLIKLFMINNYIDIDEDQVESEDIQSLSFVRKVIDLLIESNLNLAIDTNGFLIQIAAINNLKEQIPSLMKKGSSMEAFLHRYDNKDNWLTKEEYKKMDNEDCNGDREYSIYNKFDEDNKLNPNVEDMCRGLK